MSSRQGPFYSQTFLWSLGDTDAGADHSQVLLPYLTGSN